MPSAVATAGGGRFAQLDHAYLCAAPEGDQGFDRLIDMPFDRRGGRAEGDAGADAPPPLDQPMLRQFVQRTPRGDARDAVDLAQLLLGWHRRAEAARAGEDLVAQPQKDLVVERDRIACDALHPIVCRPAAFRHAAIDAAFRRIRQAFTHRRA